MANKTTIGDVVKKIIEFIKTERKDLIPLYIFYEKFKEVLEFNDVIEYLAEYYVIRPILSIFFADVVIQQNHLTRETDRFINVLCLQEIIKEEDKKIIDNYHNKIKTGFESSSNKEDFTINTFENFLNIVNKARSEKNGIVFTPTEIIDFLINSANVILQREFGTTLNGDDVAICDPFTGIAPFVVKLSEFTDEKHFLQNTCCNELVLFSYWIASLNIENTFYNNYGKYEPFQNISLSDTFKTYEETEANGLKKNFSKVRFNNILQNNKAGGVIAFVVNNSFLESSSLDGFRKSLEQEFDYIYIVDLKGNSRTRGDLNKREGENIFKDGCRTGVCMVVLVKIEKLNCGKL